jgi:hypothetical protein
VVSERKEHKNATVTHNEEMEKGPEKHSWCAFLIGLHRINNVQAVIQIFPLFKRSPFFSL